MKKQYLIPSQRNVAVAACLFAIGNAMSSAHAEFALDFKPVAPANNITTLIQCPAGQCVRMNSLKDPDTTPFLIETARDPASGYYYYHVLIGDKSSDFALDYYISQAGGNDWWPNFPQNSSMGSYNGGADAKPQGFWTNPFYAPLDSNATLSGNGTGNPQRVIFRQLLQDSSGNFSQEVLKSSYLDKPKITQTVHDGEMSSNFTFDMSALGYTGASALTTGGTITNTLQVIDSKSGNSMTNFDIKTSSQNSYVDGGKYSYTPGTGKDGSFGAYTYAPGANFDVYNVNWAGFYDKSANALNDPTQSNIPNY